MNVKELLSLWRASPFNHKEVPVPPARQICSEYPRSHVMFVKCKTWTLQKPWGIQDVNLRAGDNSRPVHHGRTSRLTPRSGTVERSLPSLLAQTSLSLLTVSGALRAFANCQNRDFLLRYSKWSSLSPRLRARYKVGPPFQVYVIQDVYKWDICPQRVHRLPPPYGEVH